MRVLITGHDGYIGSVLTPMFVAAGHDVVGLDSYLFEGCALGPESPPNVPAIRKDVRDVEFHDLAGFDAVVHLAGISNDPLGDLNPDCTYDINYHGTVHLAKVAKAAGVQRFLFSSSCSVYGAQGDEFATEEAALNPVTPYGESKILAEEALSLLADDAFSPTYLRNATAYGASPRLRGDLVVNNLVGYALTTGRVFIKSDGSPWRPLIHIEDIARAFLAVLAAPRPVVHDQAFNVGRTEENYRISEVADIVRETVAGSVIVYAEGASPDTRNYRVDCQKFARAVPQFQPQWTVRRGAEQLASAYRQHGLTELAELTGSRFQRIKRVRELQDAGLLDAELRWRVPALT
ncbi:MAG TPA: SDR family oxidoreductase [Dehalococcoidia bacterium]|nr:SDR family oxidoreductase [Dehalococcoidia bacterium]